MLICNLWNVNERAHLDPNHFSVTRNLHLYFKEIGKNDKNQVSDKSSTRSNKLLTVREFHG